MRAPPSVGWTVVPAFVLHLRRLGLVAAGGDERDGSDMASIVVRMGLPRGQESVVTAAQGTPPPSGFAHANARGGYCITHLHRNLINDSSSLRSGPPARGPRTGRPGRASRSAVGAGDRRHVRRHLRPAARRATRGAGGDELQDARERAGAAVAARVDAGRVRDQLLRALGVGVRGDRRRQPLTWDKLDYDTWRIEPAGAKKMRVAFATRPTRSTTRWRGRGPISCCSTARTSSSIRKGEPRLPGDRAHRHTTARWRVATGMTPAAAPNTFGASNYHDLVDMPFFVGRFDLDSDARRRDRWVALRELSGRRRAAGARATRLGPAREGDPARGRACSARRRGRTTRSCRSPIPRSAARAASSTRARTSTSSRRRTWATRSSPGFYAHEIFHAWNVKRLRPADMWPYRYAHAQPTPWLWVSEGITDYYADLAAGARRRDRQRRFFELTAGKIDEVVDARAGRARRRVAERVGASDRRHASTSTIPRARSPDSCSTSSFATRATTSTRSTTSCASCTETTYKQGDGLHRRDMVERGRARGGRRVVHGLRRALHRRARALPVGHDPAARRARLHADTVRSPALGITYEHDSVGAIIIAAIDPGGMAAEAGIRPGDKLVAVGDVAAIRPRIPRRRDVALRRGGGDRGDQGAAGRTTLSLPARVQFRERVSTTVTADPRASAKAVGIRTGLMRP